MPSDTLVETSVSYDPPTGTAAGLAAGQGGRPSGWSFVLAVLAALGVCGALWLISPDPEIRKSDWADGSILRRVVDLQALGHLFQSPRGLEIKDVVFHLIASLMCLVGGLAVLRGASRSSMSSVWSSAWPWFVAALLCSVAAALLGGAPRAAGGGTMLRAFWFTWWLPLVLLLMPRHARGLAIALVVATVATSALSMWHRHERSPTLALSYPLGSTIVLGACLLPAFMIAVVHLVAAIRPLAAVGSGDRPARTWTIVACLAAVAIMGTAIYLTRSRSAMLGFWGGVVAAAYLAGDRTQQRRLLTLAAIVGGLVVGGAIIMRASPAAFFSAAAARLLGGDSTRARLEHEWPFAMRIFAAHPLLGSGEGGFARQVGPLVREKQLDDPTVLNSNADSWESHAHNEVLEMLTGIGLLGTAAMLAALWFTFRQAIRACANPANPCSRVWIIALGAALMAIGCDELTNVALHKPGLPPIAMTVWACLCAICLNGHAGARTDLDESRRTTIPRWVGLIMILMAVGGATMAVLDAQSIRAQFEAGKSHHAAMQLRRQGLSSAECNLWRAAIEQADGAERWRLDPARYLNVSMMTAQFRINAAQPFVNMGGAEDWKAAISLCTEGLRHIAALDAIAPRYLQARELEGVAHTLLAGIYRDRNDSALATHHADAARAAFRANREDEPFRIESLEWLLRADPQALAADKAQWLRAFLRGGGIPPRWDVMLQSLGTSTAEAINVLLTVAHTDAQSSGDWRDRLSPETFRMAARAAWLSGDSGRAVGMANIAVTMYSRAATLAAPRRFALAHGAALHELAQYAFDNHAFGLTPALYQQVLDTLSRAELTMGGDPSVPLGGALGRTQIRVLLFQSNEQAARGTALRLIAELPQPHPTPERFLAEVYLDLARQFGDRATDAVAPRLRHWARRSAALAPQLPSTHWFVAAMALQAGDHDEARTALLQYKSLESDADTLKRQVDSLRQRFADSPAWQATATQPAP